MIGDNTFAGSTSEEQCLWFLDANTQCSALAAPGGKYCHAHETERARTAASSGRCK